METADRRFT